MWFSFIHFLSLKKFWKEISEDLNGLRFKRLLNEWQKLDLFIIINIHQKWIKGLSVFYRVRCIILDTKILVDLFLNINFSSYKEFTYLYLILKEKKLIIFISKYILFSSFLHTFSKFSFSFFKKNVNKIL